METLKEALENGPAPPSHSHSVVPRETLGRGGASIELGAATAKDTNDPTAPGKGCWSVNPTPDDPSYVGHDE